MQVKTLLPIIVKHKVFTKFIIKASEDVVDKLSWYFQVKELKRAMHPSSLKELKLDEPGRANYTYKTLGAGYWALRQKNFREAIQDIVLEVLQLEIFPK